jgi:hypothetical protein
MLFLIAATSILIFIIAIKPTIKLRQEVNEAEAMGTTEERYAVEFENISRERMAIDRYFFDNKVEKTLDDELFATISNTIDTMGIYLSLYPPIHNFTDKGFTLMTQEVIVYGEFISLLKFMNALEKDTRFFIHSASFVLETDRRAEVNKLLLKLYIQNIIK